MLYDDTPTQPTQPLRIGSVLAGRYRIEIHAGGGGFGAVYRAQDVVTQQQVAVKVLTGEVNLQDFQREVVALRALRLPGVLQLLDQGLHEGRPYIVTPFIVGTHFPGPFLEMPWRALAPLAAQLLRIVAYIHAAGAIHLDLKPENILVDRHGGVHVLDLGLVTGPLLGALAHRNSAGSMMWAAPEVLYGEVGTQASDVFSVGKMLNHFIQDCPSDVQVVLDEMRTMPRRRPSAWQALVRLGMEPKLTVPPQAWIERSTARAMIQTTDQHDREALIRHLFGHRKRVPREEAEASISTWLQAGILSPQGTGRWLVSPALAIATIGSSAALNVSRAETLRETGRPREALELASVSLRAQVEPIQEGELVRTVTLSALALGDTPSIDEALFQLGRAHLPAPELEALVYAVRHHCEVPRQRTLLGAMQMSSDDHVLSWQARSLLQWSEPEALPEVVARLSELVRMGSRPRLRARLLDWRGHEAWLAGDYTHAASLHMQAARQTPSVEDQLRSWLRAIDAFIESGGYASALDLADRLYRIAKAVSHHAYALRAVWMARHAARRAGCTVAPHAELVDAFERVGDRHYTGLAALYEAIACWHADRLKMGHALAKRAVTNLRPIDRSIADAAATLAAAVAAVTVDTPMGLDALAERALDKQWPDIDWQVLGIIASVPTGAAWRADAKRVAAKASDPLRRREVFSPQQVLDGYVAPNWRWRL